MRVSTREGIIMEQHHSEAHNPTEPTARPATEPTAASITVPTSGEAYPTRAPHGGRAPRRPRRRAATVASGALALALVVGGATLAGARGNDDATVVDASPTTTGTAALQPGPSAADPYYGGQFGQQDAPGGELAYPGQESQGYGQMPYAPEQAFGQQATSTASLDVTEATAEQTAGIVVIETELAYDGGEAAGTGIVLTEDGLVLTNHHVIAGAATIKVTTADGATYDAELVGSDATSDVALLELADASGLTVAETDSAEDLAIGDEVTAVGNALGEGLVAAPGTVSSLSESITTQSEGTVAGQELTDLIEVDADVVSGDSGGAILDGAGNVIGMTTAASSGTMDITGYAIDIDDALAVVDLIESGQDTDTVSIGYPAFLGVALAVDDSAYSAAGPQGQWSGSQYGASTSSAGATVGEAIDGTPAAEAGLVAGDVITAVDDTAVNSAEELSAAIATHDPGDQVTITWTDASGVTQSAVVTLTQGPAA